jgi:hypothetical protein
MITIKFLVEETFRAEVYLDKLKLITSVMETFTFNGI